MKQDVDFFVLEQQAEWSDSYAGPGPIELDGFMILDLKSYREGLFESMLKLFEDQTPMRIDAIRAAHAAGEVDHLRHQAHELAGGAAYIGAACLARHARAIETHAKHGEIAPARALIESLDEHAERTIAALRVILAESKGDPAT